MEIAAHAYDVRTTMLILVLFVEFPTFSNHKITHNASYFQMSWIGYTYPNAKLAIISHSSMESGNKYFRRRIESSAFSLFL